MVRKHDKPPEKEPARPIPSRRTRDARAGSVRETRREVKNQARSGRKK